MFLSQLSSSNNVIMKCLRQGGEIGHVHLEQVQCLVTDEAVINSMTGPSSGYTGPVLVDMLQKKVRKRSVLGDIIISDLINCIKLSLSGSSEDGSCWSSTGIILRRDKGESYQEVYITRGSDCWIPHNQTARVRIVITCVFYCLLSFIILLYNITVVRIFFIYNVIYSTFSEKYYYTL